MDELFGGLDDRLRASGMVADSIMMGIVNSAMESAYKNSCSKEGALVRLNEKSRFCELAIMQLEWCLKFMEDQMEDDTHVITGDREALFSDLSVTRDRIYNRLIETEAAIAEKDWELSCRMETESNLRLALEVKDEDITSLSTALGLEREKRKRSKESMEKIGARVIDEVKSCVDEQVRKIKAKIEDRQNLKSFMRRIRSCSIDLDKLNYDFDADRDEGSYSSSRISNSKLMLDGVQSLNWELEFKEMAIDLDILKENIDSSFETISSSVSLFKSTLEEQQWAWNAEREAIYIIISGFLREVPYKFNFNPAITMEGAPHVALGSSFATFMDDIAYLHEELGKLVPEINKVNPDEEASSEDMNSNYDTSEAARDSDDVPGWVEKVSPSIEEADHTEEMCEESPSCCSVAQKIRRHELFIWKKAKEVDVPKGERSGEKACPSLRSERSIDSIKDMLTRVNSSVESLIRERPQFTLHFDDLKWKAEREEDHLLKSISGPFLGKEDPCQSTRNVMEQSSSNFFGNLEHAELSERLKHLSEEKEDLHIKSTIFEEMYSIVFAGLVREMHVESVNFNIETQISEGIRRCILKEALIERSGDIDSHATEIVFMAETYHHVLTEILKDFSSSLHFIVRSSYDEHNTLLQYSSPDVREGPDTLRDDLNVRGSSDSMLVEPPANAVLDQYELEGSNDQGYVSLNGRSVNTLHQLKFSNTLLKDVISSRDFLPGDEVVLDDQATSPLSSEEDTKNSRFLPSREERQPENFELIMASLTEYIKKITDFEVIACAKIGADMMRWTY